MEFVKSRYRAPWVGVVLNEEKVRRDGQRGRIITCLLIQDRHGRPLVKRTIMRLDEAWTVPHSPVDVSRINPDWFHLEGAQ